MGVDSKAILIGVVTPVQAGAALDRAGYRNELLGSDKDHARLTVHPPNGGGRRTPWMFRAGAFDGDDANVYSGERTLCSLGASGDGPEIVRILAEEFGGFHLASDGGSDWISADGKNQVELSPEEALRVAFHLSLPGDLAGGVARAVGTDPEKLATLRDAISAYLDGAAPTPKP